MKLRATFVLAWLSVFVFMTNQLEQAPLQEDRTLQVALQDERFGFPSAAKFKGFVKSEKTKEGIPHSLYGIGAIMGMSKINYDAPPGEVLKNIGDSLVPVLSMGLSLVPGGAVIGGIVAGVWSLLSPFFGGSGKSPMEQMIDDIKDELEDIRKDMKELAKKIPEEMRKEINIRLGDLVNKAVHGQISRNQYICEKYALISKVFSDEIKHHRPINESIKIEMINQLHNCDNFLKDTTTSFVYPEFADVMWVPSVITTFVRVSFLAEVANYGVPLQLDEPMILLFWSELKSDIQRHFQFSEVYFLNRSETLVGQNVRFDEANYTEIEYEGCKLQSQILYLDRDLYPYGVPKHHLINYKRKELKIADFNVTQKSDPHHIQVYFNDLGKPGVRQPETLLNCMMDTDIVIQFDYEPLTFRVTYVLNKSYQIRVVYFTLENFFNRFYVKDKLTINKWPYPTSDRYLAVKHNKNNKINIRIHPMPPNEDSALRYSVKTGFPHMFCPIPYAGAEAEHTPDKCGASNTGFTGTYIVENVIGFNAKADDNPQGVIEIESAVKHSVAVLGVELIVLPLMP